VSDDTTRANEAVRAELVVLNARLRALETLEESHKASALANIDVRIEKNKRVIEKLKQLSSGNPGDERFEQLLWDEEIVESFAEGGDLSRNALMRLQAAVRKLRDSQQAINTAIVSGFALVDDIRSGAHEVRQGVAELNALLPRWTNLSPKVKDSIPNRVASLRAGRTLKKDLESQLSQIEEKWQGRQGLGTL
jgi:ABC-type transporter Mla subunit MlaD